MASLSAPQRLSLRPGLSSEVEGTGLSLRGRLSSITERPTAYQISPLREAEVLCPHTFS